MARSFQNIKIIESNDLVAQIAFAVETPVDTPFGPDISSGVAPHVDMAKIRGRLEPRIQLELPGMRQRVSIEALETISS